MKIAKPCAALAAMLLAVTPANAAGTAIPHGPVASVLAPPRNPLCDNMVTQTFPTGGSAIARSSTFIGQQQTAWAICWHEVRGTSTTTDPNGLVIGPVYFQKSPAAAWMLVLSDMRVSDYFVPYHPGSPRYYDLSGFGYVLGDLNGQTDCPPSVGTMLGWRVCKEIRDRGLDWRDSFSSRRGQELVLWGVIDCANYHYIQQYTFRDDGAIVGEMGVTGHNSPGDELVAHAHNAIWRIDMDVGGVLNDAVHMSHVENTSSPTAKDINELLLQAQGFTWGARTHDAVQIYNPRLRNAHGDFVSYVLMPLVTGGGLTQHEEAFTRNDFWVTPYNPAEYWVGTLPHYMIVDPQPPSVVDSDIVLWYKGSIHHMPRSEDGAYVGDSWIGVAHVMWTGFMLMPRNLFDCSPFYDARACPGLSVKEP